MRSGIIQAYATAALLLLAALAPRALADEIVMRNGARFEGRVIKETDQHVVFRTAEGTITMRRSLIREVLRKPWTAPQPAGVATGKSKAAAAKRGGRSSKKAAARARKKPAPRAAKKPAARTAKKPPARAAKRSPG